VHRDAHAGNVGIDQGGFQSCLLIRVKTHIGIDVFWKTIKALNFKSFPMGTKLLITPRFTENVERIVSISTFNQHGSLAASKLTKMLSSGRISQSLEENGTLFIGSQRKLDFKSLALFPYVAASCPYSSTNGLNNGRGSRFIPSMNAFSINVTDNKARWPNGRNGEFINLGQQLWEMQREEWNTPCVGSGTKLSVPINYEQVVAGLASLRRTYELPRPMLLSELIDVYLDLWDCDNEYQNT
jgi:hypothetical protein